MTTTVRRGLTIGSIKVDSLGRRSLTTDAIRLEQGDSYWGKGYGVVETAFVLPALNADISVYFDNVPNLEGQIFTVNDKLLCRIVQWTTGVSVKLIWFNVKAYIGADDPNFPLAMDVDAALRRRRRADRQAVL